MATKKDLVEAYSFSRRRLVTAFVSGAPGGREVEPARPGRAVIGGMAIAVLLLAGAAVLNILGSPVELDETKAQLISEKESGADYVLIETPGTDGLTLRPVINITSAMLLLGSDLEPLVVPRDKLTGLTPGQPIGILQAPATPPPLDKLVGTGWTACTGAVGGQSVGIKVSVSATPAAVPTPGVSVVVRAVGPDPDDAGTLYLIAESARDAADDAPRAYAYEVPDAGGRTDVLLGAVAASSRAQAIDVPAAWVTTFPAGGALDLRSFGLRARDVGRPVPGLADDDLEVGDVLEVGDRTYLLSADGTALLLDEFAARVYLDSVPDGRRPVSSSTLPVEAGSDDLIAATRWPEEPTDQQPNGEVCSLLEAAPGASPSVVLGRAVPGGRSSAEGIAAAGPPVAEVDPGAGALVRSGGWSDVEAPTRVLVDDRAYAYPVAGEEEAARLGYGAVPAEVVPDSWLELFAPGVLLSIDAARCPPTSQAREAPCG